MSTSQKRKGHPTPSSHRDSGLPFKRRTSGPRTRGGSSGLFSSHQPSADTSPDAYRFRPNSEAPPPTKDVPSTSTDPTVAAPATIDPSIAADIVTLVAHMDEIHKDLVERIGQVHERVDRIAECQKLNIKAVQDTLSALSQRHSEFITDVNDFIQSI
ncbi:hypothetical protein Acr_27g0002060 [Actinidia rufa]|uniref:Uncharacterized protein n=1 Tax=Actinidia rufa TaxID=165716 RepID=A0A7J0H5T9_9ERIC|nr:hypothetical protein Acr_27g0002060 [Actinidia rufa]